VRRFVAEVLVENQRMIRLIADAGLTYRTRTDGSESALMIQLDQDDRYLCAVGERERVADVASLAAICGRRAAPTRREWWPVAASHLPQSPAGLHSLPCGRAIMTGQGEW
jgi:hypothetical protein